MKEEKNEPKDKPKLPIKILRSKWISAQGDDYIVI